MIQTMAVKRIHIDKQVIAILDRYVLLLGDSEVLNAFSKSSKIQLIVIRIKCVTHNLLALELPLYIIQIVGRSDDIMIIGS
jgi:hypothetical protein